MTAAFRVKFELEQVQVTVHMDPAGHWTRAWHLSESGKVDRGAADRDSFDRHRRRGRSLAYGSSSRWPSAARRRPGATVTVGPRRPRRRRRVSIAKLVVDHGPAPPGSGQVHERCHGSGSSRGPSVSGSARAKPGRGPTFSGIVTVTCTATAGCQCQCHGECSTAAITTSIS